MMVLSILPEYLRSQRVVKLFLSAVVLMLCARLLIFFPAFQPDDITRIETPSTWMFYISQGRFLEGLLAASLQAVGTSIVSAYIVFFSIFLVITCLTVAVIADQIAPPDASLLLLVLAIGLAVTGPFGTTILMFRSAIAAQAMGALGVFLFSIQLLQPRQNKKTVILSACGVVIALSAYQAFFALLFAVGTAISISALLERPRDGRAVAGNFIKSLVIGLLIYILALILIPMLFGLDGAATGRSGFVSPSMVGERTLQMLGNLLVPYGESDPAIGDSVGALKVMLLLLLLGSAIFRLGQQGLFLSSAVICLLLGTSISALAPLSFFQVVWIDSRTLFAGAFALALSAMLLMPFLSNHFRSIAVVLLSAIIIANAATSNRLLIDQIKINQIDREIAVNVANAVSSGSGAQLPEKIVLHAPPFTYFPMIRTAYHDRNVSAVAVQWSVAPLFRLATGYNWQVATVRSQEICSDYRWPHPKSVIFQGVSAHVCFP